MGASDPSNGPIRIELDEELKGEQVGTTDYFFAKIGEAVPLKADDANYDLESLPSQPLAVSERFRLIFVAHSSGKYALFPPFLAVGLAEMCFAPTLVNLLFLFRFFCCEDEGRY